MSSITSLTSKGDDLWESNKDPIYRLYIKENRKLLGPHGVIAKMQSMYHFTKTKAQYERRLKKWSFGKNKTKRKWIEIASEVLERKAQGIDSEVIMNGSPVPTKKLKREIQRYGKTFTPGNYDGRTRKTTGWSVRTPKTTNMVILSAQTTSTLQDWQLPTIDSSLLSSPANNFSGPSNQTTPYSTDRIFPLGTSLMLPSIRPPIPNYLVHQLTCINEGPSTPGRFLQAILSTESYLEVLETTIPDPQLTRTMGSESLVKLALFLVSNDMFDDCKDTKLHVLEWFCNQQDPQLIRFLCAHADPTSDALAEKLFSYAIESSYTRAQGLSVIIELFLDAGMNPNEIACQWPIQSSGFYGQLATPLQVCCLARRFQLIKLLVEANADVNGTPYGGPTPVQCVVLSLGYDANEALEIIKYLVANSAFVDPPTPSQIGSALAVAGRKGDVELVRFLISCGANVNHLDNDGRSALHYTIEAGFDLRHSLLPIVRLLVEAGTDVKTKCSIQNAVETPIGLALLRDSLDLLRLLMNAGASFSDEDFLAVCHMSNLLFVAETLILALGPSTFVQPCSILSSSTSAGHGNYSLEDEINLAQLIATTIAKSNLSPRLQEECLSNCLYAAIEWSHEEAATCYVQAGAGTECSAGMSLALAINIKNKRLVQLLLSAGARPNWLSRALEWGDVEVIDSLLAAGADVDGISSADPFTPLATAIRMKSPESISLMLDAGADVNCPLAALKGHSALAVAVYSQDMTLIERLLSVGANPQDSNALLEAVSSENLVVLKKLLAASSSEIGHGQARFGCGALQEAIRLWKPSFMQALLESKVPVNEFPPKHPNDVLGGRHRLRPSETALGTAIIEDVTEGRLVLKAILAAGGDPNSVVQISPKRTALLLAIEEANVPAVDLLIKMGADVNAAATRGIRHTPLQAACEQGLLDVVQTLMQFGAEVNAPPATRLGATALQFAAIGGFIGIVTLLLDYGADINAPGAAWDGRTALEAAAEHGRIDMIQLLVNAGGRLVGPGIGQYARAREFARTRGHNALRRLLETLHIRQSGHEP